MSPDPHPVFFPPDERNPMHELHLGAMSVRRAFVALSACSGATVLIYQAVWTRLLTLSLGHTAPSRATIYVAFLGGLALGARLTARRAATIAPRTALAQSAFLELLI